MATTDAWSIPLPMDSELGGVEQEKLRDSFFLTVSLVHDHAVVRVPGKGVSFERHGLDF